MPLDEEELLDELDDELLDDELLDEELLDEELDEELLEDELDDELAVLFCPPQAVFKANRPINNALTASLAKRLRCF